MSAVLRFPDAQVITKYLQNDLGKQPGFQGKGVVESIAELAAARFANQTLTQVVMLAQVRQIIQDLGDGKDALTEEALKDCEQPEILPVFWDFISTYTAASLKKCAEGSMLHQANWADWSKKE